MDGALRDVATEQHQHDDVDLLGAGCEPRGRVLRIRECDQLVLDDLHDVHYSGGLFRDVGRTDTRSSVGHPLCCVRKCLRRTDTRVQVRALKASDGLVRGT